MPPEEETVEEARKNYLAALTRRVEAAEQARREAWDAQKPDVVRAFEAYDDAKRRQEIELMMQRVHELSHPKTEQVNGV